MTEVLKALRLAGRAFGDAEAQLSGRDFEQALAVKIATLRNVLVGVGIESGCALRTFEEAARSAWNARQARPSRRLKQPDR
jgi:hypothetical protein